MNHLRQKNGNTSREFIPLTSDQLEALKTSSETELPAAQAKVLEAMGQEALSQLGTGEFVGVVEPNTTNENPHFFQFEGEDVGTHIRNDGTLLNEYDDTAHFSGTLERDEVPQGNLELAVETETASPVEIVGLERYDRIVKILQELVAPNNLQQLIGEFEAVKNGMYMSPGQFGELLYRMESVLSRQAELAGSALKEFSGQAPEMESDARRENEGENYEKAKQYVNAYDELRMNLLSLNIVANTESDGMFKAMRNGNYDHGLVVGFAEKLYDHNMAIIRIRQSIDQVASSLK